MIYFFYQCLCAITSIIFFYYYVKGWLFQAAPKIAVSLKMTRRFPFEMARGTVELLMIMIFHISFIFLLIFLLSIPIQSIQFSWRGMGRSVPCGILLGIGEMGFASMLSRAMIEVIRYFRPSWAPSQVKDWLVMVRSGWLRHYLHMIDALPLPFSLLIILGQVGCEEIVFRGILVPYFSAAGTLTAVTAAAILFMFMQIFYMPSWLSTIFPLIGAMVIGFIQGAIYLKVPDLVPLIVAHFTFFIVAVL
jgi:membrane protease YdiL (CAAX protease family)